ncbi:HNH endonuclease [Schlesneria paludicola]|uniref:HNH endonuclease n=1 Tax=Schlesneria paludicola TaxID=360056 RepID=UPI0012FC3D59|nr:HNH endonuclease [Schlesneria paludicola]
MRSYSSNVEGFTCLGNRWLSTANDLRLNIHPAPSGGSMVSLIVNATSQRSWDTAAPQLPDSTLRLTAAGSSYVITDKLKNVRYVFDSTGKILEQSTLQLTDRGLAATTYTYNSNGTLQQITTSAGQDYSVEFTYHVSNPSLLVRVQVKDALTAGNLLQQVDYTYYHDVVGRSTDLGTTNDLVQVKVARKATSDPAGTLSIIRYTQYRYSPGSLLKAVFEHADIQRMMTALSLSTPESVMTLSDLSGTPKVNTFANRSFTYYTANVSTSSINTPFATGEDLNATYGGGEYSEYNYVASETIRGCGSCNSTGSLKKQYFYTSRVSQGAANGVNHIVIEDTQDSSGVAKYRTIYGLEFTGRLLRKVFIENPVSSPKYWCESWTMTDSTTRSTYLTGSHRYPSAHTVVTTASNLRTFLHPYDGTSWANDTSTLNSTSGLIRTHSFNTNGQRTDSFVQNGSAGTPYYVAAYDFGDTTNPNLITARYDYPTQTTSRSAGKQRSYSYTFYDTAHQQLKTRTTTWPTISASQNGSGVATTTREYFDNLGRLRWTQDGEGYIDYYSYNPKTGRLAYSATDVDPASPGSDITSGSTGNWDAVTFGGANTNAPSRSGSLPSPLALANKRYYDAQGRSTQVIDASGAFHFVAYSNTQTVQFPYWNSSTNKSELPIRVTQFNSSGLVTDKVRLRIPFSTISTSSGVPISFSTVPSQSDYVSWTRTSYDPVGRLSSVDRYATIPSSGSGTLGSDYYRSIVQYDSLGRLQYGIDVIKGSASGNRVEQVTQLVYDTLDRVTQVNTGVSGDSAANSHDMTDNYDVYPTLRTRSQVVYDGGGVGDGHVTKGREFFGTGSTDYTGTNYFRTYRGDLRGIEPFYVSSSTETPIGPYSVKDVDWLGRTTTASIFNTAPTWSTVLTGDGYSAYASSTATNRRTQVDTLYDDLGRVYQAKKFKIAATTGAGTNYLSRKNYFDRNDQLVATGIEYAKGTEIAYDGAGRAYQQRTVVALKSTPYTSAAFNYNAPAPKPSLNSMSGGDSGVLTLYHQSLDANGNASEVNSLEDNHDDLAGSSKGINLTNNNDYVRQTEFRWFDTVGRFTTSADFGSGDATSGAGQWKYASKPSRPSTEPTASSNTSLISRRSYNADSGIPETTVDPAGVTTKRFVDRLGRATYVASNFNDFNASTESGTGDPTDSSKDQVTKWIYDGPKRLKQLVAMDPNADGNLSDNQVTTYLYEDAVSADRTTNSIYPDSTDTTSSGSDQVKLAYNVDGSLNQRTDQRGAVIGYSYASTRLLSMQSVSTLGSGVDGSVRSIGHTYDSLRRIQKLTSYASTAGTGSIVNEVQFVPDEMDQIAVTYQSHSGAVNTSTTPKVQYVNNNNTAGSVFNKQYRRQWITYPNGRIIYHDFGPAGNPYDVLNQVRTIHETNTLGTTFVQYEYNGAGSTLAGVTLSEPSLKLDYFQGTVGTYKGRDRFGRVVDHYWKGSGSTPDADRFRYGYDYASNRVYKDIDSSIYATNTKDEAYTYDGLHRLSTTKVGTLSGSTISGTPATEEAFTLDALGNWPNYLTKASGTATLNQTRTANSANEIASISESVGATWATPAYDAAGNMTTIPKPSAPAAGYTATYDAWNRLVKLVDTSTSQTVQQNQYDGRNFRVVTLSYSSGTLSETRHAYYTDDWRCVEERVGSATTADRQFVWGDRHIDDLIVRDRGVERLYSLHDANRNVTAIVDGAGVTQERYAYSSYGVPISLGPSFGLRPSSSFNWETQLAGYRYDISTGLNQVRNRYYNSPLGVWCERDSFEFAAGMNLTAYCANDPIGLVDPYGENPEADTIALGLPRHVRTNGQIGSAGNKLSTVEEGLPEAVAWKRVGVEVHAIQPVPAAAARGTFGWWGRQKIAPKVCSGVRRIKGNLPINSEYAGKKYFDNLSKALKKKYPKGVDFTSGGFPNFTPYSKKDVRIKYSGTRNGDYRAANEAAGFKRTPEGWTWHHHEDVDEYGYGMMQLVPTDLHGAVKHNGGVSVFTEKFGQRGYK